MASTMQLLVEAPAIEPYRYGLASVAQPVEPEGVHWQLGVKYEPLADYEVGIMPGACDVAPTIALPAHVAPVSALPFSLYAGVDCKAPGYDEAYVLDRARTILQAGWQHGAEQALWTGGGVADLTPVLNAASGSTTVGTGLSLVAAVAALEAYLGSNYLGRGVIHAPRSVGAYAGRDRQAVERVDGVLETKLGTRWAFGGGYDGTGPNDVAASPTATWLYATGVVQVRRGPAFVNGGLAQALNRTTNGTLVFAEQPVVLTVDGPIAAVSVDLTL